MSGTSVTAAFGTFTLVVGIAGVLTYAQAPTLQRPATTGTATGAQGPALAARGARPTEAHKRPAEIGWRLMNLAGGCVQGQHVAD